MNATVVFDPSSSFLSFQLSGVISFHQTNPASWTFVKIHLKGFPPNKLFACHVHEYGDLTSGCESACSHFNPYKQLHGSFDLYGPNRHVGDLAIPGGNLQSDKNGHVIVSFYDDLVSLFPNKNCIIGRMIVIHEHADDQGRYRSQTTTKRGIESGKTGNAGKRVACAVIGLAPSS